MAGTNPLQPSWDNPLNFLSSNLLSQQLLPERPKLAPATASADKAAPRDFHRFGDLPPELRIAIWELALPHRIHEYPRPGSKFVFSDNHWTQEQVVMQPPAIAHVCAEARSVAYASGSVKKTLKFGRSKLSFRLKTVWVDSKRDTAVLKMYFRHITSDDTLYALLRSREMRIALDSSWSLAHCMLDIDQARKLYYDLVHGHKECDFVIVDLQLFARDKEAAGTGLFDNSGTGNCVLVPIEDKHLMSRLFAAQAESYSADWCDKWANFTQFRKPRNLLEYATLWEKLGAREMRHVRRGLDLLTGVEMSWWGKDADERRAQAARNAVIQAKQPKLRPVIMVSRRAESKQRFDLASLTRRLGMDLRGHPNSISSVSQLA